MLIQFAEEKMAIGNQCYDLISHHLASLEREISAFETDMQVRRRQRLFLSVCLSVHLSDRASTLADEGESCSQC